MDSHPCSTVARARTRKCGGGPRSRVTVTVHVLCQCVTVTVTVSSSASIACFVYHDSLDHHDPARGLHGRGTGSPAGRPGSPARVTVPLSDSPGIRQHVVARELERRRSGRRLLLKSHCARPVQVAAHRLRALPNPRRPLARRHRRRPATRMPKSRVKPEAGISCDGHRLG